MKYILFYIDKDYNILLPRVVTYFEDIISFNKLFYTNGLLGSYYPKEMVFTDKVKVYDTLDFKDFLTHHRKKDIIFLGSLEIPRNNVNSTDSTKDLFNLFDKNNITIHHSYCFNYGYDVINDIKYKGNIKDVNIDTINRDLIINDILS